MIAILIYDPSSRYFFKKKNGNKAEIYSLQAWEDIIYKHYELMYALDDDECKFGKAIPLPSYHHVHQVGGLICGACGYT